MTDKRPSGAILLVAMLIAVPYLGGCDSPKPVKKRPVAKFPYKFIATKTDADGSVMDLYAYAGELKPSELQAFCRQRKANAKGNAFYFVTIFDSEANARFPSNPYTAHYGIDEKPMSHIRAMYEFNRTNGYSELAIYSPNMWEGKATRYKLP